MSKVNKVTTDGIPNAPLGQDELGYDELTQELYIGSGSGTGDGVKLSEDAGEIKLTSKSEIKEILDYQFNAYGYTDKLLAADRFTEGTTPNVVTTGPEESVRFLGGLTAVVANSTITLPLAPFAPTTNDEVLDDRVHGLTCQVVHSKGDIVVTGGEAVENGSFETVADGEIGHDNGDGTVDGYGSVGATLAIVGNALRVSKVGSGFGQISINTVIGAEYTVTGKVLNDTAGQSYITIRTPVGAGGFPASVSGEGLKSFTFIATTSTQLLSMEVFGTDGGNQADFDDLSVKLTDSIKQATVDSPSNDLTTADWQTLDGVTTQDVVTLRKHKTTKVVEYHVIKGIHNITTSTNDEVAIGYGFSKIGRGLYEDATYEYILVRWQQSYNTKIYDAVYNPYGTATSVNTPTSIYDCASLANDGNGPLASATNANGVYYDKVALANGTDISTYARSVEYKYIVEEVLATYMTGANKYAEKVDQTLLTTYLAHAVQDSTGNKYFPLNEKAGMLQINEVNADKTAGSLVLGTDGRLLLQVVNDTNSTDTVDLTSGTNKVVYLPYYKD